MILVVGLRVAGRQFGSLVVTGFMADKISGRLVVIDPGHGGHDPGAVAPDGILEKDIVLNIAKHLQGFLNQAAVHTILTREGNDSVKPAPGRSFLGSKRQDLIERAEIANRAKADLFISIHCNSFPQSIWSGAQTFYYPGQAESKRLAVVIQSELVRRLGPNRRQANAGDYRVLKDTHMPAVVVEVGFLSNPREARLLADPSYQKKVAEAIYWGILRYY
jgi:N-acetylmuramoyl-L-alanine amidase